MRDLVADDGTVLFVGTKKQVQDPVQSYATKCGMPYVNQRWLGGMLTNFATMSRRIAKMQEYRRMAASGELDLMPKKEALLLERELTKLERNLGGIDTMENLPDAVFILDTKTEHIAVTEANKLGIPIIAVVDTNCDPDEITYVIPGNDDAMRSGSLLARVISDAVLEGRQIAARRQAEADTVRRSAEDEARVAAEQAEARNQAARAQAEREARLEAGESPQAAPEPEPTTEAPAEPASEESPPPATAAASADPATESE